MLGVLGGSQLLHLMAVALVVVRTELGAAGAQISAKHHLVCLIELW
jgi:hypothetical protein